MKTTFVKILLSVFLLIGWLGFGSWRMEPYSECASDSLAIVRVVKPLNALFDIKPVVYVSKGSCRIDEVKVSDLKYETGDLAIRATLSKLLLNGYTIQTSTETFDAGLKLNTYYLKKKAT